MRSFLNRLVSEEDGATMVEYALMVALIAVVVMAGAAALGTAINTKFDTVKTSVSTAGN